MRVHHVITRLIVGGAQENTIATVLGLRGRPGVAVRLISGPTTGPEGSLEPMVAAVPGLLSIVPELVRPVHPLLDARAFIRLVRVFRDEKPDIVHTHSGKAGTLGRLAARSARVPLILHTIHGPSFGPFQGPLANGVFRSAERIAGRCTHHFVTVADAMTRQYLAAGIGRPDQYTRVFSGFDLTPYLNVTWNAGLRARLGLRPDDFVVGMIARLFALKGHDDLITAAPGLVAARPHIRFLLVGDGPWRDRLQAEIDRRGLARHFVFAGLVPPAEIPDWIGAMDLLVHLSRREGLPRALPQALAAGRPVVAYDCDGASEVCIDGVTGYLVAPGDLHTLRSRIIELADHPALRERLAADGRRFVADRFPVACMVDQLHELYCRLLERSPRAGSVEAPAAIR